MGFPTIERGLDTHLVIYVPTTKKVTEGISPKEIDRRVGEAVDFLNKTFGGSTRVYGVGSWVNSDTDSRVDENIIKVECFTTIEDYNKAQKDVRKFLISKKRAWGQATLSYEFEETLYFI